MIWVGRLCVIVIFVIVGFFVMNLGFKVLELVFYVWVGFGGVFLLVILFILYKKDLYWKIVLIFMIIVIIIVIVWKISGLGNVIYEIVLLFVINCMFIYLLEKFRVFEDKKVKVLVK